MSENRLLPDSFSDNEMKDSQENTSKDGTKNRESSSKQNNIENNKVEDNIRIRCCGMKFSENILHGITFPARLIMTLYSFQALFFLYNCIINFIFLLPGMLYFNDSYSILFLVFFVYIFFASFCSNILIIPTYELLLFNFLRHKNVLTHLQSLRITINIIHNKYCKDDEINEKKSNSIINFIFIIIEIGYIIGFFLGFSSRTLIVKDLVREFIYILIYFYYLVIFFGYLFVSIDLKIHLLLKMYNEKGCCGFLCNYYFYMDEYINKLFGNNKILPKINLLCYVVNPLLKNSYENPQDGEKNSCCHHCFFTFKNLVRSITFFFSFIVGIYITSIQKSEVYVYFVLLFFYFYAYFVSSMLNFPYIIRNKKLHCLFRDEAMFKEEYKLGHPIIVSLIRLVSFLIIAITSIGLLFIYATADEGSSLESISNLEFIKIPYDRKKPKLEPSICHSSIQDLYIDLYLPFINDAYYYNNNPTISPYYYSSFQIKGYKELFFDDTYDIQTIGNLIESNEKNKVKMIQYDVTKYNIEGGNKTKINEITILAIKGTTNKKDIFLDVQLYLPSILLNFLSFFSIFSQNKQTYSFGFVEYGLSLPYRCFSQYLIIDGYIKDLLKAYNNNKSKFKNNIIIVGHSLGGGLSKILGRFLGKQAISLSGPGVNAFHSLWEYEGSSDDFEISAIDLVPDMDLVPRVEVSGGTIYRIVCKEGPLDCHGKELSLCEVLIMCRNPNYEQYCKKMQNLEDWQIDAIKKSSEL